MTITIRDISVAPDATEPNADVATAADIRNRVYAAVGGSHDEDATPQQYLQESTGTTQLHRMWLVEEDGVAVALARLDMPLDPGATTAHAEILVLPQFDGRGIGTRAHEVLEGEARAAGRLTMTAWAEHPANPAAPQLVPPTGFGTVPHDHISRFALRHGYTLEQVDRRSVFDLHAPFDTVEAHLADAEAASAGYDVVAWTDATPPRYLNDMANLRARMSTDAPSAGLDSVAEAWDAARVIENDARRAASGDLYQITAGRHVASGQVVAFNVLSRLAADGAAATMQGDTLVLREHRGHRLGMLVKCRGLLAWHEHSPLSPRVLTWNAEENRPMLSINEALGFAPAGYIGAWQKVL